MTITLSTKAVFVDTSALPAHDTRSAPSGLPSPTLIQNHSEAALVAHFTQMLIRHGVRPSQIGVITVYRAQVVLLLDTLRKANCDGQERIDRSIAFWHSGQALVLLSWTV